MPTINQVICIGACKKASASSRQSRDNKLKTLERLRSSLTSVQRRQLEAVLDLLEDGANCEVQDESSDGQDKFELTFKDKALGRRSFKMAFLKPFKKPSPAQQLAEALSELPQIAKINFNNASLDRIDLLTLIQAYYNRTLPLSISLAPENSSRFKTGRAAAFNDLQLASRFQKNRLYLMGYLSAADVQVMTDEATNPSKKTQSLPKPSGEAAQVEASKTTETAAQTSDQTKQQQEMINLAKEMESLKGKVNNFEVLSVINDKNIIEINELVVKILEQICRDWAIEPATESWFLDPKNPNLQAPTTSSEFLLLMINQAADPANDAQNQTESTSTWRSKIIALKTDIANVVEVRADINENVPSISQAAVVHSAPTQVFTQILKTLTELLSDLDSVAAEQLAAPSNRSITDSTESLAHVGVIPKGLCTLMMQLLKVAKRLYETRPAPVQTPVQNASPVECAAQMIRQTLECWYTTAQIIHSGLIETDIIKPLEHYEKIKKGLFKILNAIPSVLVGVEAGSALIGSYEILKAISHSELLGHIGHSLEGLEAIIPHHLIAHAVQPITERATQAIGLPPSTQNQILTFYRAFQDADDFNNKKNNLINHFKTVYEDPLKKLNDSDAKILGHFVGQAVAEWIRKGLFERKAGASNDFSIDSFVNQVMILLSYSELKKPERLRYANRIITVEDLLQKTAFKFYCLDHASSPVRQTTKSCSGQITLTPLSNNELQLAQLKLRKSPYTTDKTLGYRILDPAFIEPLNAMTGDAQSIEAELGAASLNFKCSLVLGADFEPKQESQAFAAIQPSEKTDRERIHELYAQVEKLSNSSQAASQKAQEDIQTMRREFNAFQSTVQQEANQQAEISRRVQALERAVARSEQSEALVQTDHAEAIELSVLESQRMRAPLTCQAQATAGNHPERQDREDPDPDADLDVPGPSWRIYSAGRHLIHYVARYIADATSEPGAANNETQGRAASAWDDRDFLNYLAFYRDIDQHHQNIILPARSASQDDLLAVMHKCLVQEAPSDSTYTCFIPTTLSKDKKSSSIESLVVATHQCDKNKRRVQSMVVAPKAVDKKALHIQVAQGFSDYYRNERLQFETHSLTLKSQENPVMALLAAGEWLIQHRHKWIDDPWRYTKLDCKRFVEESIEDVLDTEKKQQQILKAPDGYITRVGERRRHAMDALLKQDLFEFSLRRNQSWLREIEQAGKYAEQHPDSISGRYHRIGRSQSENDLSLALLKTVRDLKLKEAKQMAMEKRQSQPQTDTIDQVAVDNVSHLGEAILSFVAASSHMGCQIEKEREHQTAISDREWECYRAEQESLRAAPSSHEKPPEADCSSLKLGSPKVERCSANMKLKEPLKTSTLPEIPDNISLDSNQNADSLSLLECRFLNLKLPDPPRDRPDFSVCHESHLNRDCQMK